MNRSDEEERRRTFNARVAANEYLDAAALDLAWIIYDWKQAALPRDHDLGRETGVLLWNMRHRVYCWGKKYVPQLDLPEWAANDPR